MTRSSTVRRIWRTGQLVAVATLAAAIVGLFGAPVPTLDLFWNLVVPLVPASLLVTPELWRNLCPLATVHMARNRPNRPKLTNGVVRWTGAGAIALLFLLVPARRFLFNQNGPVLAAVILAVLAAAFVLGALFDTKAGFCNAVCPVLPVERLYGQAPLLRVGNPRCVPCTLCTQRGCIDLAPHKGPVAVLGEGGTARAFATSPFGLFAAAFPGFVIGYFTTADVAFAEAGTIYLHIAFWTLGSAAVALLLLQILPLSRQLAGRALGAAAVGLYYWYAASSIAEAFTLGEPGAWAIRVAAGALIATWLVGRAG